MLVAPKIVDGVDEGIVGDGLANMLDGGDTAVADEFVASNATGLQNFKFDKSVSVESVGEFLLPTDRESNPNLKVKKFN